MTDRYVYYFMRTCGPDGSRVPSKRRATLEAIKGKGDPIMESQIVVDQTELDGSGFLVGGVNKDTPPIDAIWAQIRSLERRANSRDTEALTLSESDPDKYMLSLESRELRAQVMRLSKQRQELLVKELDSLRGTQGFGQVRGGLTTE
ncbi:MAG: hypothetical protein NVS1B6_11570 [Steroidobacteraceae bacterium]